MIAFAVWIVNAIVVAWGLISGATAVAGAATLTAALALLPETMGTAPQEWLNVANYYLPINETISLVGVYFVVAGAMKFLKLSNMLKNR